MEPCSVTVYDSTYAIQEKGLVIPKQRECSELPAGEWNAYDIAMKGSALKAEVNGVVRNVGAGIKSASGFIALQIGDR